MLRRTRTARFPLLFAAAGALMSVIVLSSAQSEAHAQTQVPPDTLPGFEDHLNQDD